MAGNSVRKLALLTPWAVVLVTTFALLTIATYPAPAGNTSDITVTLVPSTTTPETEATQKVVYVIATETEAAEEEGVIGEPWVFDDQVAAQKETALTEFWKHESENNISIRYSSIVLPDDPTVFAYALWTSRTDCSIVLILPNFLGLSESDSLLVLIHEIGHCLLGVAYKSGSVHSYDPKSIMYFGLNVGKSNQTITEEDRNIYNAIWHPAVRLKVPMLSADGQ